MVAYAYYYFQFTPGVVLITLACLAALPTVVMYVVAPLKVRRNQSRDAEPRYEPLELTQLEPDVAWTFHQSAAELAALGFTAAAHLSQQLARTRQSSVVSLWVNRAAGDTAQVIAVKTMSPATGAKLATLVTFRTEFTDGTAIATSNTATASVFPPNPTCDSVTCPWVCDLRLLYRFHRARVTRDAAGRTATTATALDGPAYMRAEHVNTFQRLVRAGYYVHNPDTRRYDPTFKGAFLITYRLLWPWKQINRSARHRKADRLLRELGFGGMEQFRMSQRPPQWASQAPQWPPQGPPAYPPLAPPPPPPVPVGPRVVDH